MHASSDSEIAKAAERLCLSNPSIRFARLGHCWRAAPSDPAPAGSPLSTIELVNALEEEKARGKAGHIMETLVQFDLLILVELGYLPFRPQAERCSSTC